MRHTYAMESVTNMVYLEDERLAREAQKDTAHAEAAEEIYCLDCGAHVTVYPTDAEEVGICRCLCGQVWEVEMAV